MTENVKHNPEIFNTFQILISLFFLYRLMICKLKKNTNATI